MWVYAVTDGDGSVTTSAMAYNGFVGAARAVIDHLVEATEAYDGVADAAEDLGLDPDTHEPPSSMEGSDAYEVTTRLHGFNGQRVVIWRVDLEDDV